MANWVWLTYGGEYNKLLVNLDRAQTIKKSGVNTVIRFSGLEADDLRVKETPEEIAEMVRDDA